MNKQYETVIGLEVHVELSTKTKIFCGCRTSFGSKVNTNTCPVCTGMPGSLPVLNKEVLRKALLVGLATNCQINKFSKFDRKNYFYPDNPQNYQISQLYLPICHDGYVEIETCEQPKKIGICEIHMEEDAGKLIHDVKTGKSFIDYNRSGVPLIEIVSKPDMNNADEVIAFLENLKQYIQYLGASDCKLEEGSMRVDVNLSVKEHGRTKNGTRTEMKNLNSFRAIRRAIENEELRQIDIINCGEKVEFETRRWDDNKGMSFSMRSKEDAKDYRYFPDPDLMPLLISDEWISELKSMLPEFAKEKIARYKKDYCLSEYDAKQISLHKKLSDLFERTLDYIYEPKEISNLILGDLLKMVKIRERDIEDIIISPINMAGLVRLVVSGSINRAVAKDVFEKIFDCDIEPEKYVKEHNLLMVNDEGELLKCILEVIKKNGQSVSDYKAGKVRAMGYIVGQVMKEMKKKADPISVNRLVKEELDKL